MTLATALLCFGRVALAAEQPIAAEANMQSDFGLLLVAVALVLGFTVVARRPSHHEKPSESTAGPAAAVGQPPRKATVHQLPSRNNQDPSPTPTPMTAGKR